MDLYTKVAYETARHLTLRYSTSFGISSRFFGKRIQPHIFAIYGLVRVADEVVDTYKGTDARQLLDDLEAQTYQAIRSGYSPNPIVHAFSLTARDFGIDRKLIGPFFESMRMDLAPQSYSADKYRQYIHGSAEVVGLMCLRVFCDGNDAEYENLKPGAAALGSAYQKVNFLRDLATDHNELGRLYFPGVTYEKFDEAAKHDIIADIESDFDKALPSLLRLPVSSRKATLVSYVYYKELLTKLKNTQASVIKTTRIRLPSSRKLVLIIRTLARHGKIR